MPPVTQPQNPILMGNQGVRVPMCGGPVLCGPHGYTLARAIPANSWHLVGVLCLSCTDQALQLSPTPVPPLLRGSQHIYSATAVHAGPCAKRTFAHALQCRFCRGAIEAAQECVLGRCRLPCCISAPRGTQLETVRTQHSTPCGRHDK